MNRNIFITLTFVAVLSLFSAVYAGGVNYNSNQSAEVVKVLNRNASTDPDAAYFNPAGTALMEDGFYAYLSNQTVYQPLTIDVKHGRALQLLGLCRREYNGMKYAWYFPDFFLVYKKGNWAWSFGGLAVGGGGSGEFNNGLQMIDIMLNPAMLGNIVNGLYQRLFQNTANPVGSVVVSEFSGSSTVYSAQTSVAYSVLKDLLSFSLGYRIMYGYNIYDGKLYGLGGDYYGYLPLGSDFHATQKGLAHGVIIGLSAKPIRDLTIGLRGEWNSPLRMKTASHDDLIVGLVDSSFRDGSTKHGQLPANLDFGVSYRVAGLQISCAFAYYFNQYAQMNGIEESYTGGYDIGIGLDYTFRDVPVNIGCGYTFAEEGARPSAQSQLDESINSHNIGCGISYTFNRTLTLTIAHVFTRYVPEDVNKGQMTRLFPVTYNKMSFNLAIGITWKVF
ncbi:MAG: hypothetical protein JW807_07710 [Spirochaetes bacterium]|nr:hypothetical protein [Spirochaetota bacterium]